LNHSDECERGGILQRLGRESGAVSPTFLRPDGAVFSLNLPHLTRCDAPHADLAGVTSRVAQNSKHDPVGHIDAASTSTLLPSWQTIT
jgi:hypothetical protein